jgi:hypothetical protein
VIGLIFAASVVLLEFILSRARTGSSDNGQRAAMNAIKKPAATGGLERLGEALEEYGRGTSPNPQHAAVNNTPPARPPEAFIIRHDFKK